MSAKDVGTLLAALASHRKRRQRERARAPAETQTPTAPTGLQVQVASQAPLAALPGPGALPSTS
jgi:hypothetical protein